MAIPASGRTGWSTTSPTRKHAWPKVRSRTIAAKLSAMRCPCSTTASGASSRRVAGRPLFQGDDGAAVVVVDHRDVEPAPLLQQLQVAILVGVLVGQADKVE